ncbi:hypothetical protein PCL_09654 [Purpureocillium lilacinum]|uniref:Uncharacterized protein n=1 Tax=Purpureocillium lilacinum TaxID=33203 RepID=A0A2U3EDQ7_PURLI|nr:hypothetical protein PCL_09654 [Purpureocillium lilacinum]
MSGVPNLHTSLTTVARPTAQQHHASTHHDVNHHGKHACPATLAPPAVPRPSSQPASPSSAQPGLSIAVDDYYLPIPHGSATSAHLGLKFGTHINRLFRTQKRRDNNVTTHPPHLVCFCPGVTHQAEPQAYGPALRLEPCSSSRSAHLHVSHLTRTHTLSTSRRGRSHAAPPAAHGTDSWRQASAFCILHPEVICPPQWRPWRRPHAWIRRIIFPDLTAP